MQLAKKGKNIKVVLRELGEALSDKSIYSGIALKDKKELFFKTQIKPILFNKFKSLFISILGYPENKAASEADKNFYWESGDKAIHSIYFLDTGHRPDFFLIFNNKKIAIEVKRGHDGTGLRQGLGQSIVYTTFYDFCIFVFIDTDGAILNAFNEEKKEDRVLIDKLFDKHNVYFIVVGKDRRS